MVDLILITHNRDAYLQKMLPQLFKSPEAFRLYIWDNGSGEATKTILSEARDERIAVKQFSPENAGQGKAFAWFLEQSKGELLGKIDDDILLPPDWISRIEPVILQNEKAGMLGCWIFTPEDWKDLKDSPNYVMLGKQRILRWPGIQGHSFLVRSSLVRKYVHARGYGLPVDQAGMTADGFYCGYPLPLLYGHNMDDPRSEHLAYSDLTDSNAALTWRARGFTRKEYAEWIAADAFRRQVVPFELEQRLVVLNQKPKRTLLERIQRRFITWRTRRIVARAHPVYALALPERT